jgi:hypothetical protein
MTIQPFQFPLTDIIFNGDWEEVARPAIREMPHFENEGEADKAFNRVKIFKRIIAIEFTERSLEELGLHRSLEGKESIDTYAISMRSNSLSDADLILTQLRKILISIPNETTYGQYYREIRLETITQNPDRAKWWTTFEVKCYLTGKVI